MMTIAHGGLVHEVVDANKERRAGCTACFSYLDFKPNQLDAGPVTCLRCLGDSGCTCGASAKYEGHDFPSDHNHDCPIRWAVGYVQNREKDLIDNCQKRGTHDISCDRDGFCDACGYQTIEED